MRNFRKISLCLFVFLFIDQIFSETEKEKSAISFEKWKLLNDEILSSNPQTRKKAVLEISNYKEEEMIQLIRELILRETDGSVMEAILEVFEKRKNRADFFYLVDFLKVTPRAKYGEMAMKILHEVHKSRFQWELKELFMDKKNRVLLLTYMKSISEPNEDDIKFIQYCFRAYNFAEYYASFHAENDKEISDAFEKYGFYSENFQAYTASDYFWFFKISFEKKRKIDPSASVYFRPEMINEIPRKRIREFAGSIAFFIPEKLKLDKIDNADIAGWIVKSKLFGMAGNNESLKQLVKTQFTAILKKSKSEAILSVIIFHFNLLEVDEKKIVSGRCSEKEISEQLCFALLLRSEPEKAAIFFNNLAAREKSMYLFQNLDYLRKIDFLSEEEKILLLITDENYIRRLRGYMSISHENYIKYAVLISSILQTEPNKTILRYAIARICEDAILSGEYKMKKLLPLSANLYLPSDGQVTFKINTSDEPDSDMKGETESNAEKTKEDGKMDTRNETAGEMKKDAPEVLKNDTNGTEKNKTENEQKGEIK